MAHGRLFCGLGFTLGLCTLSGLFALLGGTSCQEQAGMFCQQQSDCRVGLLCAKPVGASDPDSFGVCAPALRGMGEICLSSADCQPGLMCSNEIGIFNGDERHGICEVLPDVDGGISVDTEDLARPADLAELPDLLPHG
jgi:hypothetical protein